MNLENIHYDAFISYRHCELDMFVAKTLHKYLESFKLPRSVRKAHPDLPAKISRVFRDQEELPLVANLGDPITEALKNSSNLIVICTPRLKESLWCRKEIETFMKMHGREHVFVVLAEGEPADSFPEELLKDEEGILCEPLAADFRGANRDEIKKRMKDEGLRLLAPMFGLNFDDLKQRHREQRMHRILAIGSAVMAVVLAFGTYSAITAHKIKKQSEEIAAQNVEISRQAGEIEQQYKESLKKYEISMADASDTIMSEGRRMEALYALYYSMPKDPANDNIPYAAEAQKAMTKALGCYSSGDLYMPMANFDAGSGVTGITVSPGGVHIAALNESYNLVIWDVESGEEVAGLSVGDLFNNMDYIKFLNDDAILTFDEEGEYIYDIPSGNKTYISDHVGKAFFNSDHSKCMVVNDDIILIDTATAKAEYTKPMISWEGDFAEENYANMITASFSDDGSKFGIIVSVGLMEDEKNYFVVYDTDSGDMIQNVYLGPEGDYYTTMCMHDNMAYVSATSTGNYIEYQCVIIGINMDEGKIAFTNNQLIASFLYDMRYYEGEEEDFLYARDSDGPFTLSPYDGSVYYNSGLSSAVVDSFPLSGGKFEVLITKDGTINRYVLENGLVLDSSLYEYEINGKVKDSCMAKGKLFLATQGRNYVTLYEYLKSPNVEFTANVANYDYTSDNLKYGVILTETGDDEFTVSLYDTLDASLIDEFKTPNYRFNYVGDGDDGFVLFGREALEYYDIAEKKHSKTIEFGDDIYLYDLEVYGDGNYLGYFTTDDGNEYVEFKNTRTGEDAGIKIDITGFRLISDDVACSADGSHAAVCDSKSKKIYIYNKGDTKPYKEIMGDYGVVSSIMYSSDGKYLFIVYNSNTMQIYDAGTCDLVKTSYGDYGRIWDVISMPANGNYLIKANTSLLLNPDMEEIAEIYFVKGYNRKEDKLTFITTSAMFSSPVLSYDEIIKRAAEELGSYQPDARILSKYNVQ
ncbi:MAG: TIR domain-containing protein [Lachnospiraceae bacterium]|nr:TIR domain-containing protein [Lachnospiraceae bacterium]